MAQKLSPAQMRAAYTKIKRTPGIDADLVQELDFIAENTGQFTDERSLLPFADNFADLVELSGVKLDDTSAEPAPAKKTAAKKAPAAKKKKPAKAKTASAGYEQSEQTNYPAAPKSVTKLLDGMDDEACRLLVASNDKAARTARKEAEFRDFQSEQLKAGKTAAEVAALTPADMKQKRTLRQVANAGAEHLIHAVTKHVLSKAGALKGDAEKLREKRESLEAEAAQEVARFAQERAQLVAEKLKTYARSLVDGTGDTKARWEKAQQESDHVRGTVGTAADSSLKPVSREVMNARYAAGFEE